MKWVASVVCAQVVVVVIVLINVRPTGRQPLEPPREYLAMTTCYAQVGKAVSAMDS